MAYVKYANVIVISLNISTRTMKEALFWLLLLKQMEAPINWKLKYFQKLKKTKVIKYYEHN